MLLHSIYIKLNRLSIGSRHICMLNEIIIYLLVTNSGIVPQTILHLKAQVKPIKGMCQTKIAQVFDALTIISKQLLQKYVGKH